MKDSGKKSKDLLQNLKITAVTDAENKNGSPSAKTSAKNNSDCRGDSCSYCRYVCDTESDNLPDDSDNLRESFFEKSKDSSSEKVVAFIDLGTNSARLLIVRLNSNKSYTILRIQKEPVRLGEGEFETGIITPEAMARAVTVCRHFADTAENFGAEEIIAVATSATRDAKNRDDFLKAIRTNAGLNLSVISGVEEARLIYRGVAGGISIGDKKHLFIDIGGGSTEIIVGDQFRHYELKSLKLGAIRTTNRFFGENYTGSVSEGTLAKIRKHVLKTIAPVSKTIGQYGIKTAIGSSGTIQALIDIKSRSNLIRKENQSTDSATIGELDGIITLLCSKTLEERKQIAGVNPNRADIIIAGAVILHTLMKVTGIVEIKASDRGLRDGLLIDYLSKLPGFPHAEEMSVKRCSVIQLGKSCRIDEKHAESVIAIALSLFDSARELGLHDYSDNEREYLEYAAYLHDTGQFISYQQHQYHAYYIIRNAPLLGFTQKEIEIIALIARYHRKRGPKKSDAEYSKLEDSEKRMVAVLSLFLRMAEHMERSRDGRIRDVRIRAANNGELKDGSSPDVSAEKEYVLEMRTYNLRNPELWALDDDLELFERTFGVKLIPYLMDS